MTARVFIFNTKVGYLWLRVLPVAKLTVEIYAVVAQIHNQTLDTRIQENQSQILYYLHVLGSLVDLGLLA